MANQTGSTGADTMTATAQADTMTGIVGNDSISGLGSNDLLYGGPASAGSTVETFRWSSFCDGASLAAPHSQDTGVTFTYTDKGAGNIAQVTTQLTQYRATGESFATNSAGYFHGTGAGADATLSFAFTSEAGSGNQADVFNVQFRINDIDKDLWTDVVKIHALDSTGALVPVTITLGPGSTDTLSDQTITAATGPETPNSAGGSALITIAGPVQRIFIDYSKAGSDVQFITLTDVTSTTLKLDNDAISGGDGLDSLYGGAGNDSHLGGSEADMLYGEAGNDTLDGEAAADSLAGEAGADLLYGGEGADALYGGAGNDIFVVDTGFGSDQVTGGDEGGDFDALASASASAVQVVFNGAEAGTMTVVGQGQAVFSEIEGIWTGNGADLIDARASGASQWIWANDGADTILGGTAGDAVDAGAGDDLVDGGAGADGIWGGAGSDTIKGGIGDIVDGGAGDQDLLDLSSWGSARTHMVYSPGDPQSGTVQFLDGQGAVVGAMAFSNIEKVMPCFTPGTRIATPEGARLIEDLRVGDLVLTRDHGPQVLRWVGARVLSLADLIVQPALRPIRLAGRRDLIVSPQHRMLIEGARAEMLFGEAEVLVAARHLPWGEVILPAGVTYRHLLFDAHEIIVAEGVWAESFQPAARMVSAMEAEIRREIEAFFPDLGHAGFPAARLTLKAYEARVLLEA